MQINSRTTKQELRETWHIVLQAREGNSDAMRLIEETTGTRPDHSRLTGMLYGLDMAVDIIDKIEA